MTSIGIHINREVFWNNLWKIWIRWLITPHNRFDLYRWSNYLDKHLDFINDAIGVHPEDIEDYNHLRFVSTQMKRQLRLLAI